MVSGRSSEPEAARKLEDDSELLQELVADHGVSWVVQELGVAEVRDYLLDTYEGFDYVNLAICLDYLEEKHYPQAIVQLLRDHQQCPWLTPVPSPNPNPS